MYKSESHFKRNVIKHLKSNKNSPFHANNFLHLGLEFNYRSGITDIIMMTKEKKVIAIELKLNKWKKALNQAYRNTSFAHYCYVLLPQENVYTAAKYENEFVRKGVGLAYYNRSQLTVLIRARGNKPLTPWLTKSAISYINGDFT